MPKASSTEEICGRFNSLNWHDSELRGFVVNYSGVESKRDDRCEIILSLNLSLPRLLSEPEMFAPTEIRFLQARFFHADVDLLGVTYCGGDISDAKCGVDSQFMRQFISERVRNFTLPQDDQSLADLRHFGIYLCNPSGEINIVAKDFIVTSLPIGGSNQAPLVQC
jgi:hypothetical protein